jgi:signal transducing adaptor molecule
MELQNTHAKVKSSILEKMAEWSEIFKSDPGLGIMEQSFSRLKSTSQYPCCCSILLLTVNV